MLIFNRCGGFTSAFFAFLPLLVYHGQVPAPLRLIVEEIGEHERLDEVAEGKHKVVQDHVGEHLLGTVEHGRHKDQDAHDESVQRAQDTHEEQEENHREHDLVQGGESQSLTLESQLTSLQEEGQRLAK